MIKDLRFKKENGKWYIDLPFWPGPKHALMMVAGANKLLNIADSYTGYKGIIECTVSTKYRLGSKVYLDRIEKSLCKGATYKINTNSIKSIWLCPVTLFVFGRYPKRMYIEFKDIPEFDLGFTNPDEEVVSADFSLLPLVVTLKRDKRFYIFIHSTEEPYDAYVGFEANKKEVELVRNEDISFDEYKILLKELYNKAKKYFVTESFKELEPCSRQAFEDLDINTDGLTDSFRYYGGPIGLLDLAKKGIMMG